MTFTAEIPTSLFKVKGFKGLKFSVDKKPGVFVGGTMGFQATCYGSGNDNRFFKATGATRKVALAELLGNVK